MMLLNVIRLKLATLIVQKRQKRLMKSWKCQARVDVRKHVARKSWMCLKLHYAAAKKLTLVLAQKALVTIPIPWHALKVRPHVVGSAQPWRAANLLPAPPPNALTSPRIT